MPDHNTPSSRGQFGGVQTPWNTLQNVVPTPSSSTTFRNDGVAFRLYLQSLVRELLPAERVADCLRKIAPEKFVGDGDVKVCYRPPADEGEGRSFFKNLMVCRAVWFCPPCSSKITEGRRSDLGVAVQTAADLGLYAVMLTFTVRHQWQDRLSRLLEALRTSFQKFHAGRWSADLRSNYGIEGHVRTVECTQGQHGWHPHYHELLFMRSKLDTPEQVVAFEDRVKSRWVALVADQHLDATWEHGLNVRSDALEIAEYVAKYGYEPVRSKRWGVEHEVSKGAAKVARQDGRTPFQLVADYGDGDVLAGELFQEYARVFKGQRQLYWSRGLKKLLGVADVSDAELVNEEMTSDVRVLASLSAAQWRVVLDNEARAHLLRVARSGSSVAVIEFLEALPGMEQHEPTYSKQVRSRQFQARWFRLNDKVSWLDETGQHYGWIVATFPAGGLVEVETFMPGSAAGYFTVRLPADVLHLDDF